MYFIKISDYSYIDITQLRSICVCRDRKNSILCIWRDGHSDVYNVEDDPFEICEKVVKAISDIFNPNFNLMSGGAINDGMV